MEWIWVFHGFGFLYPYPIHIHTLEKTHGFTQPILFSKCAAKCQLAILNTCVHSNACVGHALDMCTACVLEPYNNIHRAKYWNDLR